MIIRDFISRIRSKIVPVDKVLITFDTPGYILNLNLFGLGLVIKQLDFRKTFYNARLVHVDGKGAGLILWLLLGDTFRPCGYRQWAPKLFEKSKSKKIFFLGGTELENGRAISNVLSAYNHLSVDGINGYASRLIINEKLINADPDLIFVGMGMPKQELLIEELSADFPNKTFFACGGWIKQLAGLEKNCPKVMSYIGLEWLYRSFARSGHLTSRVVNPALLVLVDLLRR